MDKVILATPQERKVFDYLSKQTSAVDWDVASEVLGDHTQIQHVSLLVAKLVVAGVARYEPRSGTITINQEELKALPVEFPQPKRRAERKKPAKSTGRTKATRR